MKGILMINLAENLRSRTNFPRVNSTPGAITTCVMQLWILLLAMAVYPTGAMASYQAGVEAYNAKDYPSAFAIWSGLADDGDREAMYSLGGLYADGLGVTRDITTAIQLYRKAVEQGHARAAYSAGVLSYKTGANLNSLMLLRLAEKMGISEAAPVAAQAKGALNPLEIDDVETQVARMAKNDDEFALLNSARTGNIAAMKKLIAAKVNVNAEDVNGLDALKYAAYYNSVAQAELLLDNGARINGRDHAGRTALMYAAGQGHTEMVKALLGRRAKVLNIAQDGESALTMAMSRGHQDIARLLMDNGAEGRLAIYSWMDEKNVERFSDAKDAIPRRYMNAVSQYTPTTYSGGSSSGAGGCGAPPALSNRSFGALLGYQMAVSNWKLECARAKAAKKNNAGGD